MKQQKKTMNETAKKIMNETAKRTMHETAKTMNDNANPQIAAGIT